MRFSIIATFISTIFLFSSTLSYGRSETDSLLNALASIPKDTAFVNLTNKTIKEIFESNPTKALSLASDALEVAKKIGYEQGYANLQASLGWLYYRQGDIDKAFTISQEALNLLDKIGSIQTKAEVLNNIAAIYNEQEKYKLSLEYFEKALAIQISENNLSGIVRCYNNLAFTSLKAKDYALAQGYIEKALEANKNLGNQYYAGFAYRNQGDLWYAQKKYKEAIEAWRTALDLGKETNSRALIVACLNRISNAYIDQEDFVQAQVALSESIKTAEVFRLRSELRQAYQLMAKVAERLEKPYLAIEFHKKFFALHDSLFNENTTKKLNQLESTFEAERKEKEIQLLKAKVKEDRLWIFSALGGLVALAIIAFLIQRSKRKIRKALGKLKIAHQEIREKTEEILQQKEEIEQINETLTQTNIKLDQQSQDLKALNATKDKLFAIIGHDLRNPIGALISLLQLLEYGNISQEEFLLYSNKLKASVESLHFTLHNLLVWANSQMQGIKATPQVFDLQEIAQENVNLLSEIAKNKNIDLSNQVMALTKVNADIDHVKLILRNLLSNALKFTSQEGKVSIKAEAGQDFVKIAVSDTGVGMAEEKLHKLFTPAVTSTKGTDEEKGTGLGLMLCKDFVEKNGGQIWVESQVGKGSTFYFTLPK
ncbi:tetratricopeptide repeat-containing sensor histidine kinase [Thermoflexibacter ruber]|uniref:histidine kinase n=1 Tax=Thermoflexibacter ruber TaxID=1003 RepID=A0A1I2HJ82_9BACT|nr:ATP-binding protein [Thermoflexibacter ruber]SFF29473.1 Signal transduction histidine kinase [Thermoflexibacter ruber]